MRQVALFLALLFFPALASWAREPWQAQFSLLQEFFFQLLWRSFFVIPFFEQLVLHFFYAQDLFSYQVFWCLQASLFFESFLKRFAQSYSFFLILPVVLPGQTQT